MQCILILFTPPSSPNSFWIHPQPLPPSNLPQLPDFFLKNNSLSPVCAFHVFKDVWLSTGVWSTYQWLDPWRKIGSASLRSHRLSQAPQLWVGGSKVSLPAVLECSLACSYADNHSWCEFMSPIIPRRHCFSLGTFDIWLLQSFWPLI